jgi:hypothetical protein
MQEPFLRPPRLDQHQCMLVFTTQLPIDSVLLTILLLSLNSAQPPSHRLSYKTSQPLFHSQTDSSDQKQLQIDAVRVRHHAAFWSRAAQYLTMWHLLQAAA